MRQENKIKRIHYLGGILLIVLLLFAGFYYYLFNGNGVVGSGKPECYDCGRSGWQKNSEKCGQKITDAAEFKSCLNKVDWSQIAKPIDANKIKEGYIKIGEMDVFDKWTIFSIEVFIYGRIAADKDGNLYILTYTG